MDLVKLILQFTLPYLEIIFTKIMLMLGIFLIHLNKNQIWENNTKKKVFIIFIIEIAPQIIQEKVFMGDGLKV